MVEFRSFTYGVVFSLVRCPNNDPPTRSSTMSTPQDVECPPLLLACFARPLSWPCTTLCVVPLRTVSSCLRISGYATYDLSVISS